MEKIISLAKQRGFIYAGSQIYGGLANTWDYGPLGSELKNNLKRIWWKNFIQKKSDMLGLDASILMNAKVWEASGHVSNFTDPLVDCKSCKARHRGDKLLEEKLPVEEVAGKNNQEIHKMLIDNNITCPDCGKCDWTEPRNFNLMFETNQGVVQDKSTKVYLRPETAQGIFVNFKNVLNSSRKKLPFGIGQIGKAFRNEITPGNFTFRTREFEQMEIEYFVNPAEWKPIYDTWRGEMDTFYKDILGLNTDKMRWRQHEQDELSHYSSETWDIEFLFPFGWGELWGIAYRTDFDLRQHSEHSGEKLEYRDPTTNEVFIPHCIEPTFGCDRTALAILVSAYHEEQLEDGDTRVVMKFKPELAPYKVAILPLMKKDGLKEKAEEIYTEIAEITSVDYDETGSIGKRYRRQDEIGTPYCVTIDYDTMEDGTITLRDRDTMEQKRITIQELKELAKTCQ
ncbi:MAG: glycine--tRNA ligase [Candidatus Gracilibacteria bacterium]|jgi:glycyl-tRNA synthetase|nr:glycine--tRNA ligase [Candidatus Gracilibacteria bacterium]